MVKLTVIYGEGRGKTSLSIGYGYLQEAEKKKVTVVQFLKTGNNCGECYFFKNYDNIRWFCFGREGFFTGENKKEYINIIEKGFQNLFESLKDNPTDLLLLDELGMALEFELVNFNKIKELFSFVNEEIIVTGRNVPLAVREKAHKIIKIEEKKHPYNQGITARKGIDF